MTTEEEILNPQGIVNVTNVFSPNDPHIIGEAEYWQAQEMKHRAHAAEADARLADSLADAAELAFKKDLDRWQFENAGELDRYILRFPAAVDADTVRHSIDLLSRWDLLSDPEQPFRIVLTSPGGEIFSGISLHAYLRELASRRPIVTVASGLCASMATVIHQAGTTRLIERATSYLIHDASSFARGNLDAMRDQVDWIGRINDDLHKILAERSTLTQAEIAERAKRKDWTLTAEEAVQYGFADEVI